MDIEFLKKNWLETVRGTILGGVLITVVLAVIVWVI